MSAPHAAPSYVLRITPNIIFIALKLPDESERDVPTREKRTTAFSKIS